MGKVMGCGDILQDITLPVPAKAIPHPLPGGIRDLRALLGVCKSDQHRALVGCLGFEGMRMCEVLTLRPRDIDMHDKTLRIWGKGSKVRVVPFTKKAQELILPVYLDKIFIDPKAPMIEYSDRHARAIITQMGVAAGISRPIASHDLRATFATLAYAKTRDAKAVQNWLGHASGDTTAIYIEVPMDTLRIVGEID
jgi:integrase